MTPKGDSSHFLEFWLPYRYVNYYTDLLGVMVMYLHIFFSFALTPAALLQVICFGINNQFLGEDSLGFQDFQLGVLTSLRVRQLSISPDLR